MKLASQEKYNAHQEEIRGLIKQLETRLERHAKQASQHPAEWGYAGDLGHVAAELAELVNFFR